jgi:hypothetical protein
MVHHHPAVLVVGDDDMDAGTVGLRLRGEDSDHRGVPVEEAADRLVGLCRAPR